MNDLLTDEGVADQVEPPVVEAHMRRALELLPVQAVLRAHRDVGNLHRRNHNLVAPCIRQDDPPARLAMLQHGSAIVYDPNESRTYSRPERCVRVAHAVVARKVLLVLLPRQEVVLPLLLALRVSLRVPVRMGL